MGAKRLHVWHPRGILNRNLFLVYPWPYIKYANIYYTQKCFLFVATYLTANFFVFLLLPGKVYADVINGLQYPVAKVQTKSEMYAKYWNAILFGEKYDYKNRSSIKTAPKINLKEFLARTIADTLCVFPIGNYETV